MARAQTSISRLCLNYLLSLRLAAFGGTLIATVLTYRNLDIPFPIIPVCLVLLALMGFTLSSWFKSKTGEPISENYFIVQLIVDSIAFFTIFYFTGGSANPFLPILLLPVVVATATVPIDKSWLVATTTVTCYSGLMFIEVPNPQWGHVGHGFTLHVWGMWFGFLLSATMVVYFIARMAEVLRNNDRALAQAREQALQAEQFVTLGSLAAGTAHELGTPLATIAVLSTELQRNYKGDPSLAAKLTLLREQVDRCKTILAGMAAKAGQIQADTGEKKTVDTYLDDLLVEWHSQRPQVKLSVSHLGPQPAPQIIADRTLTQAITNVLNNAADVSRHCVEIETRWDAESLTILVHDEGGGLSDAIREKLGKPFATSKPLGKGLGLGLFLARTTINRLGGTVQLLERNSKGITAEIILPLSPLLTSP